MSITSDNVFQSIPERYCDPLAFYTIAPKNSQIAIYGAGKAGELFHDFIKKFRSDITALCYVDSFRSGSKNGLPVVKVDQLHELQNFDYVVICSSMYREIEGILKFFEENRYIVVSQKPKYSSRYFSRNKDNFSNALDMLHSESDKNLYKLLIEYSSSYELMINHPDMFVEKLKSFNSNNWYLDYINTREVQTAVDGGAFDGDSANHFLKYFNNLRMLHCFDLSFSNNEFYNLNNHFIGDKRVKFHEQGLSDKKENQHIVENSYQAHAAGTSISRDAIYNREISCTSLDIFSEENNVGKIDYIKMDIEGAEFEALNGCRDIITKCRPQLAICIYHELDDMWSIPMLLKNICNDYIFRLSHYSSFLTETVLYAIPRELYTFE